MRREAAGACGGNGMESLSIRVTAEAAAASAWRRELATTATATTNT